MVRPRGPSRNRPVRRYTTARSDRHDAWFLCRVVGGFPPQSGTWRPRARATAAGWLGVPTATSNARAAVARVLPHQDRRQRTARLAWSTSSRAAMNTSATYVRGPNRRRRGFRVGSGSCEVGVGGTLHPGGEFLGLVTVGNVASDHPLDVVGHLGGRKLVAAQLATETRVQSEGAA